MVIGSDGASRATVGVGGGTDKVSIREAATLLGVHPNTVRYRVKTGVYEAEKMATKHGPTWMIARASLSSNASASEPERLVARPGGDPTQSRGPPQISEKNESSLKPKWRRWVFAPLRLLAWPFVSLYHWIGGETRSVNALVRISEVSALIAVLVAAGFWLQGIPQRQQESEYQAWQVVDAAAGTKTSKARIIALELLNESQESFEAIDLAGAYMSGIVLPQAHLDSAKMGGANLSIADLSYADLTSADLSEANLLGADLDYVSLWGADLDGANLRAADMRSAYLIYADLDGANLTVANLEGANLRDANLRDANLEGANLEGAQNVTNARLEEQASSLEDATLPNGQKYEDWLKDKEGSKGGE